MLSVFNVRTLVVCIPDASVLLWGSQDVVNIVGWGGGFGVGFVGPVALLGCLVVSGDSLKSSYCIPNGSDVLEVFRVNVPLKKGAWPPSLRSADMSAKADP